MRNWVIGVTIAVAACGGGNDDGLAAVLDRIESATGARVASETLETMCAADSDEAAGDVLAEAGHGPMMSDGYEIDTEAQAGQLARAKCPDVAERWVLDSLSETMVECRVDPDQPQCEAHRQLSRRIISSSD